MRVSEALDAFEMTTTVSIIDEPLGSTYRALLDLASEVCGSFSLVWRDDTEFNLSAHDIATKLEPLFIREERTDRWPGTKLFGHFATVRHYRVDAVSMCVLEEAGGLYARLAPNAQRTWRSTPRTRLCGWARLRTKKMLGWSVGRA